MTTKNDQIATALIETLISPNESDSNWEAANVVDGLFAIARSIRYLAKVIDAAGAPVVTRNQSDEKGG